MEKRRPVIRDKKKPLPKLEIEPPLTPLPPEAPADRPPRPSKPRLRKRRRSKREHLPD